MGYCIIYLCYSTHFFYNDFINHQRKSGHLDAAFYNRSVWLRSKRLAPMLWPVVPGGETPRVVQKLITLVEAKKLGPEAARDRYL